MEEEIEDLQQKLLGKDEENSSVKKVNQELLEEIKALRKREQENQDGQNEVYKLDYKEELLRLKRHHPDLYKLEI